MKENIDKFDNVLLPILFSTLGIMIRMLHDQYEWRLDELKNYMLRLWIGIIFTTIASFLINKDMHMWNVDLYWTSMFLIWLFGMEISLFLLDKDFMKSVWKSVRDALLRKIK